MIKIDKNQNPTWLPADIFDLGESCNFLDGLSWILLIWNYI